MSRKSNGARVTLWESWQASLRKPSIYLVTARLSMWHAPLSQPPPPWLLPLKDLILTLPSRTSVPFCKVSKPRGGFHLSHLAPGHLGSFKLQAEFGNQTVSFHSEALTQPGTLHKRAVHLLHGHPEANSSTKHLESNLGKILTTPCDASRCGLPL